MYKRKLNIFEKLLMPFACVITAISVFVCESATRYKNDCYFSHLMLCIVLLLFLVTMCVPYFLIVLYIFGLVVVYIQV